MKAKVRKIKLKTNLEKDDHRDSFVEPMDHYIGKVVQVKPYIIEGKKSTKWFSCMLEGYNFNFHKSWLNFNYNKDKKNEK
jgi:hypothetical protein